MTQAERDRLVVLKKAQKKLITQTQAAAELELSERQVRRLLVKHDLTQGFPPNPDLVLLDQILACQRRAKPAVHPGTEC